MLCDATVITPLNVQYPYQMSGNICHRVSASLPIQIATVSGHSFSLSRSYSRIFNVLILCNFVRPLFTAI
jgi:hypothetical protein